MSERVHRDGGGALTYNRYTFYFLPVRKEAGRRPRGQVHTGGSSGQPRVPLLPLPLPPYHEHTLIPKPSLIPTYLSTDETPEQLKYAIYMCVESKKC